MNSKAEVKVTWYKFTFAVSVTKSLDAQSVNQFIHSVKDLLKLGQRKENLTLSYAITSCEGTAIFLLS